MTPVKKTTKKAEAKKVVEEVKTAAETVAEEVKAAPEKVEEKAAPKKTAAKKTVRKAAAKEEPAKAAEPAKEEPKKAVRKTAAKKAAAPETSVYVEFYGKQFSTNAVVEQALNVYKDTHKDAEVKTIEVYVKPEENVAYYVVNGEGSDDYKIYL